MKTWWKNLPDRYKNFWFWAGLAGTCLASLDVDPNSLTSYAAVGSLIADVLSNPVKTCALIVAIIGVWVNPTTKGIRDEQAYKGRRLEEDN